MSRGTRRVAVLFGLVALVAASAAYVVGHFRVENEITHFLPPGADATSGRVLRLLARTASARTTIVVAEGRSLAEGRAAAEAIARDLGGRRGVEWVATGPDPGAHDAFRALYVGRQLAFLADGPPGELEALLDDDGLREALARLGARLRGPEGPMIRATAAEDPLLVLPRIVRNLQRGAAHGPRTIDGGFVTRDGRAAVLLYRTRASGFDHAVQARLLDAIEREARGLSGTLGPIRVEVAGVAPIAVATADAIRADIERVSSLSLAFLGLLFLVLFRSPRYLALAFLPLAIGTLVSTAVVLFFFGSVHGLTLAFGSSLTGVSIDYVEHLISHHVLNPDPSGPEGTTRRIRPGLVLGAMTTVGGFAALGFARYPGIREIAVFCAVGVTVAFLVTLVAVPSALPVAPRATRAHRALARALVALHARAAKGRRWLWAIPAVGVVVCAIGLPRVRFEDDFRALGSSPPRVLEADRRVRARALAEEPALLVAATGRDLESALARNDALALALEAARRDGLATELRSVHDLLWSRQLQERNLRVVAGDRGLAERLRAAADRAGFVGDAFEPFLALAARAAETKPLSYDELARSRLGPLAAGLVLRDPRGHVVLTEVRGALDEAKLHAVVEATGAHVVDREALFQNAYRNFRESTLSLVGVGLLLVLAICFFRYRRPRWALAAFVPSVLASAVAIAVLALSGRPVDLLHVIGLLLVLSMGVDYGVFVVESRDADEELGPTLASIVVAMSTTILSFGVLGMSEQPALRSIGTVTALGVALSVVFAPLGILLASRGERK